MGVDAPRWRDECGQRGSQWKSVSSLPFDKEEANYSSFVRLLPKCAEGWTSLSNFCRQKENGCSRGDREGGRGGL